MFYMSIFCYLLGTLGTIGTPQPTLGTIGTPQPASDTSACFISHMAALVHLTQLHQTTSDTQKTLQ